MKKSTVYLLSATPVNRKVYVKCLTSSPGKQKIVSETTYDPGAAQQFETEPEARETLSQLKSIHSFSVEPSHLVEPKTKGPTSPFSRKSIIS